MITFPTVCDKAMLDGENAPEIPGAKTPDTDGARVVPLDDTGSIEVSFPTTPSELTQLKVTPPDESRPGDKITVTVEYTPEDGSPVTKVSV